MEIDMFIVTAKIVEICILFSGYAFSVVFAADPTFDVPVVNVTVVQGAEAVLPCTVGNLGDHKVVWTDEFSTLLTFDVRRIIDDDRISVERPVVKDWNLLIRNVLYSDRGKYVCQINTKPIKTKAVILNVLVPPSIDDSTDDVIAKEGDTVQLVCNATGVPPPTVHWFRKISGRDSDQTHKERVGETGEILIIHNVSRYCDGKYECLASNGVHPNVLRTIEVMVEFKPEIVLQTKRIGQYQGKNTILECEITAVPQALTLWKRDGRPLYPDGIKYRIDIYTDEHKLTLSLSIRDISSEDYGRYTCYAENKLGKDKEDMVLYESFHSTIPPSTTIRKYDTSPSWKERENPFINPEQGKNVHPFIETVIVSKGANSPILAGNKTFKADARGRSRTDKSEIKSGAQSLFNSSLSCTVLFILYVLRTTFSDS